MLRFPSLKVEGGLLGGDLIEQIFAGSAEGQSPKDFGFNSEAAFSDYLAFLWNRTRELWEDFQARLEKLPPEDPATTLTRERLVVPLLELLGYQPTYQREAVEVDGRRYHLSHRADPSEEAPFVHIVGIRQILDKLSPSGPRMSPHAYVQDFLNRTEHLWAIVTNGAVFRLLRDSQYLVRQAYIEFNLQEMLANELFADFQLFVRLVHRTRLPKTSAEAEECLLERYRRQTEEQGSRIRDKLRDGVEKALKILGKALLRHPRNEGLRQKIREGHLKATDFYEQLLRLIYRVLFLLVAEERNLLAGSRVYRDHYSISRLRRLTEVKSAWSDHHDDLWLGLQKTFQIFADEQKARLFNVAPLNGDLFRLSKTDAINDARVSNEDLLRALWHLCWFRPDEHSPWQRVNYAALDVEELGSIYESLLDFHPTFREEGGWLVFELAPAGMERKSTGSYYTPRELVGELVKSALEPVLLQKEPSEHAILSLKILDPACGSGHFLLAAARRLATELARIRTGEEQPNPQAYRLALRDVVRNCLYGVDKNPLAVELCKVALWIESHAEGKPLAFLDHHIKCGDSLVGVLSLDALTEGIPDEAYEADTKEEKKIASRLKRRNRNERANRHQFVLPFERATEPIRQLLTELTTSPDDEPEQVREKERRYSQLRQDPHWWQLQTLCHLWTAPFFAQFSSANADKIPTSGTLFHFQRSQSAVRGDVIGYAWELAHDHRFFHWPLEFPEVFAQGGFDVVLGNPPFMGGLKISGTLGPRYRHWLEVAYKPFSGTADLCAAFFRRAFALLKPGGRMGMVATNTISQGDTRESGLAVILREDSAITFARRFIKWPGAANVEVNLVAIAKKSSDDLADREVPMVAEPQPQYAAQRSAILDGEPVPFISSRLDTEPEAEPKRLRQNEGKAFQGDIVRGIGFVLGPEEAQTLLAKDARNADCLFPYLNGEDLNSHPEQQPSRWVICFHDWDLARAEEYSELLRIVEERVKPERDRLRGPGDKRNREYWWQFGAYRAGMRRAIAPLRRVLVRSRVSELHALVFVPKGYVYGDATVVFAFDDHYHFALLQSNIHEAWLRKQASSLRTDVRYTPTDCFDTFPFPQQPSPEARAWAERVGEEYHEHRRQVMLSRWLGLTRTYNLFHDPECCDEDIQRLRDLHAEMDHAILACYGWDDIDPQHGFYQNERGQTRFTISPKARREILHRLLELNLQLAKREAIDRTAFLL